jgi:pyruvate dehydrogenase E2 component (dihydrolipoamide acetyltransferase)
VKRLAAEHGIDLQAIAGTGPGGRIVKDDVMPYVSGAKPIPTAAPAAAPAPAPAQPQVQPVSVPSGAERPAGTPHDISRIRRTTGRRMLEAKQTIPHFYVSSEIDMGGAVAVREQINGLIEDEAGKISFNDMVVKATALALREFPNLNTSYENDQIVEHPNIDMNIAVAIEGGLIAPFVADADQKSLGAIARQAKDLIGRARNGGLQPNEFQGGTFTISNLGMFDVEEFIAVINPPQAAILAVSSIKETPVVDEGEIKIGHRMKITVSADHRVTDGAEVARFLLAVKKYLQNPMLLALS